MDILTKSDTHCQPLVYSVVYTPVYSAWRPQLYTGTTHTMDLTDMGSFACYSRQFILGTSYQKVRPIVNPSETLIGSGFSRVLS